MAKISDKYEVLYIINPNLSEEETQGIVEKFKTLVEQNGTIDEMEEWGKRKLAYEILHQNEGYYYFIKVDAEPSMAVELESELRLRNETVLRYLIVREG